MALRALGTVPAAEEAAQETLARAVVALHNGQPKEPEHVAAFVAGIARHVIVDTCRARKRTESLDAMPDAVPLHPAPDVLSTLISAAEQEAVRAALSRLS